MNISQRIVILLLCALSVHPLVPNRSVTQQSARIVRFGYGATSNYRFLPQKIHSLRFRTSLRRETRRFGGEDADSNDSLYRTIGAAGVASNLICFYSLYVLRMTSCGLPPGPFGLLGATEGVSYLIAVGIFAWSIGTKLRTGSGLPAGPAGLLGAAEGLSFLTVLGGIVIAGLNVGDYGFLPGFLPNDACFGINSS